MDFNSFCEEETIRLTAKLEQLQSCYDSLSKAVNIAQQPRYFPKLEMSETHVINIFPETDVPSDDVPSDD
jgi:hypothetical protein